MQHEKQSPSHQYIDVDGKSIPIEDFTPQAIEYLDLRDSPKAPAPHEAELPRGKQK